MTRTELAALVDQQLRAVVLILIEARVVGNMFDGHHGLDLTSAGLRQGVIPERIQITGVEDVVRLGGQQQPRPFGELVFELAGPQPEWPT